MPELAGPLATIDTPPDPGFAPVVRPTGFSENYEAALTTTRLRDNPLARSQSLASAYQPLVDALNAGKALDGQLLNPGGWSEGDQRRPSRVSLDPHNSSPWLTQAEQEDRLFAEIAARRAADKGFLPGVPANAAEFRKQWLKGDEVRLAAAEDIQSRQTWGGLAGSLAGGTVGSLHDPVAAMPYLLGAGAGGGLLRSTARQVLLAGASETALQPFVASNYAAVGQDYTAADFFNRVGSTALGAGVLHVGAEGVPLVLNLGKEAASSRLRAAFPEWARSRDADAFGKAMKRSIDAGTFDDRMITGEAVERLRPGGEDLRTPDEQAAGHAMDHDIATRESSPFEATPAGEATHGAKLAAAVDALDHARPVDVALPAERAATPRLAPRGQNFDSLVDAVVHRESRGNPDAVSPAGARGRMQVMPGTNRDPGFGVRGAVDDSEAERARVGRDYLAAMLHRYDGNQVLALAAYNAGPGHVDGWLHSIGDPRGGAISETAWLARVPFEETRNYVPAVLAQTGVNVALAPRLRADQFATPEAAATAQASIDASFAPSPPEMPQIGPAEAAGTDLGASGSGTAAIGEALSGGRGRAPSPYFDQVRSYVRDTRGSLQAEAIAKRLDIEVEEARAALSQLASSRESGLIKGSAGELRRKAVRRGPVDVLTFLADNGGIRDDEGHGLVRMRNLQQLLPGAGPLIRKTGMSIDEAGELLTSHGYFPLGRPTEDEVLQLLERGNREKVYRPEDANAIAERDAARAEDHGRGVAEGQLERSLDEAGFDFDDGERDRAIDLMAQGRTAEEAMLEVAQQSSLDRLSEFSAETEDPTHANEDLDGGPSYPGQRLARTNDAGPGEGRGGRSAAPGDQGERGAAAGEPAGAASARGGAGRPGTELERFADRAVQRDLADFDDPAGPAAVAQVESLEHDLRMAAEPELVGAPPKAGVVPANIGADGKIYVGKPGDLHFSVAERYPDVQFTGELGFVNPEGRYLAREQALEWVNAHGADVRPSENMSGQLDALDYREQVPAAIDRGAEVDPALADRQRQQAEFGAAAPLRRPVEQDGTMGLALFDQADQPQLFATSGVAVEGGTPVPIYRSLDEVLRELDADDAAIKAAKDCL